MWEDQSKQYWKEKEAIKKKESQDKNLLYSLVVFFLLCCVGGFTFGRMNKSPGTAEPVAQQQQEAKKVVKTSEGISLFSKNALRPEQKVACLAEASDERYSTMMMIN